MLKKINRLQKDREFMKVFKIARPVNTENFAIRVMYGKARNTTSTESIHRKGTDGILKQVQDDKRPTPYAPRPTRIGIVISNKIDKRATRRNELKRKIRAIVREILPEINGGHDIIIQVKKAPEYPYDFHKIRSQIESALTKK